MWVFLVSIVFIHTRWIREEISSRKHCKGIMMIIISVKTKMITSISLKTLKISLIIYTSCNVFFKCRLLSKQIVAYIVQNKLKIMFNYFKMSANPRDCQKSSNKIFSSELSLYEFYLGGTLANWLKKGQHSLPWASTKEHLIC